MFFPTIRRLYTNGHLVEKTYESIGDMLFSHWRGIYSEACTGTPEHFAIKFTHNTITYQRMAATGKIAAGTTIP